MDITTLVCCMMCVSKKAQFTPSTHFLTCTGALPDDVRQLLRGITAQSVCTSCEWIWISILYPIIISCNELVHFWGCFWYFMVHGTCVLAQLLLWKRRRGGTLGVLVTTGYDTCDIIIDTIEAKQVANPQRRGSKVVILSVLHFP